MGLKKDPVFDLIPGNCKITIQEVRNQTGPPHHSPILTDASTQDLKNKRYYNNS